MLMGDEVVQDDIAVGIYRLDRFFNVGFVIRSARISSGETRMFIIRTPLP